jgi:predicted ATP-grasp superfamily ATP-dependent carboligase
MSTANPTFDFIALGDNVRSVVASALRAGYGVWCADATHSLDLQAMLPTSHHCSRGQYPHGFTEILAGAPEGQPWLYTSAINRYPNLLRQLIDLRSLAGNGVNAVGFAHSHDEIKRTLRELGCLTPEVRRPDAERPDYCRWLAHTDGSVRGFGQVFIEANTELPSTTCYLREHIEGVPLSASFVASGNECRLLGVTELFLGTDWLHAPGLEYAGDIGPVELPEQVREELLLIGNTLVERGHLRGLFAVDFVLRDNRVWTVHVQPSYTESMEIIELACETSVLAAHWAACGFEHEQRRSLSRRAYCVARGVVHAPCRLTIPNEIERVVWSALQNPALYVEPLYSDVPRPGEVIEQGWPIMSIFAYGSTKQECLGRLQAIAKTVLNFVLAERPRIRHTNWYARLDDDDSD